MHTEASKEDPEQEVDLAVGHRGGGGGRTPTGSRAPFLLRETRARVRQSRPERAFVHI